MIRTFSLQEQGFAGLEEYVLDTFERMYRRLEQDQPLIPPSQWHQLRYEDLVSDPVGQMRRLYQELDLKSFSSIRTALQAQRRRIARYRTNRYQLTPAQRDVVTQRWRWVMERYGYPVEPTQ
jgi:hypothetical protein